MVQVLPYIKNHSTLLPSLPICRSIASMGQSLNKWTPGWLIKERRIMNRSHYQLMWMPMSLPMSLSMSTICLIGMGAVGCTYAKFLSQADWKKSVHFRCVDQHWRHAYLPASTYVLGLWPTRPVWETQNRLFQYAFILALLFEGVIYHAVLQQTRQECTLRRTDMQFRGRLTISFIP